MVDSTTVPPQPHAGTDTFQSFIVAFVIALLFRGFVVEGFFIPTGSMAPTLMGQHALWHSKQTGSTFRVDTSAPLLAMMQAPQRQLPDLARAISDPMLPYGDPIDSLVIQGPQPTRNRSGDGILVTKWLYPFCAPKRWDVVVFANPTDPLGEAQTYIKRLVGLPNEKTLFIDGDVFAGPAPQPGALSDMTGYAIQRKPEHVQRAVWQPVYHSEYLAINPEVRGAATQIPWHGEHWQTTGRRSFVCDTAQPTVLQWDNARRPINDWNAYNMIMQRVIPMQVFSMSDLRVSAGVVARQAGLDTTLEIAARQHVFQFTIGHGQATVRMRPAAQPDAWTQTTSKPVVLPPPGRAFNVEFWHVDQSMAIYIDGHEVVHLNYDWSPPERLQWTTGKSMEDAAEDLTKTTLYPEPTVAWHFSGSPVTLHRVHMDRDLFYQPMRLQQTGKPTPTSGTPGGAQDDQRRAALVKVGTPGFGTSPGKPAILGPDQFLMCGDNSPASTDSRAWGNPDPLVAAQIDPDPFIVNRKLLQGKAWAVYFPATYRLTADSTGGGPPIIPDVGRLRFIR